MRLNLAVAIAVAALSTCALARPGAAFDLTRSCSLTASNNSSETLSFSQGYATVGAVGVSLLAAEVTNLPYVPHPDSVKPVDTIAPGGTGADYLWSNPIDGVCGAHVAWAGSAVEKNSNVADSVSVDINDPPIGSNTYSCQATGSLDCSAIAVVNDHDLAVLVEVGSRTVYDCIWSVTNDTGNALDASVAGSNAPSTLDAGATTAQQFSFSYDGCSGDFLYQYPTGSTTTCAPPRMPVYPRCQTTTTWATAELTFHNDASGLGATCAPQDPSLPIGCTLTFASQSDHTLSFTADVTTGRSTQGVGRGPTAHNDVLHGTAENDVVRAKEGDDLVAGGRGHDNLGGGPGNDSLLGGAGEDTILGGPGRDVIHGGSGNDRIWARDGERDVIDCGAGRDHLVADRSDEWHHCESVDLTGRPLPRRHEELLLARDLPGSRWHAGDSRALCLPDLEWDDRATFVRAGHGLAAVSVRAAAYATERAAKNAARHWTRGRLLPCGAPGVDLLRLRRGRTLVVAGFVARPPARPAAYERAIVRSALVRATR